MIDYSVFLLIVDRQKKIPAQGSDFSVLVYDAVQKEYLMKEIEEIEGDSQALQQLIKQKKEQEE